MSAALRRNLTAEFAADAELHAHFCGARASDAAAQRDAQSARRAAETRAAPGERGAAARRGAMWRDAGSRAR